MEVSSPLFKENAARAMRDERLRKALGKLEQGFPVKRRLAAERLPEFEDLRDAARDIKVHVLENLDYYLEKFEQRVTEAGGKVHWCRDAEEARRAILAICRDAGARTVTKSKSMVGEEIAINDYLEANGVRPVETDLGEYIIQLRNEPPSHIIAPAIHLSQDQVEEAFRARHIDLPADRDLREPRALLNEARAKLRTEFLAADVGITGANMLIAETGSVVIVTNEGNADLTQTLPRVNLVVTGIEKVVPTLEDATTLLRVLARSATGQEMSVYTTFTTGPAREDDLDGPREFHVILLDNGRSGLLGGEFHDVLRCIRCGACLNHCPVYGSIGGHAYGWVYPGPVGSVLTPALVGLEKTCHLPHASSLCGRCESVCPMRIPLPSMLRHWRERAVERNLVPMAQRIGLAVWAFLATRPPFYRLATGLAMRALGLLGRRSGRFTCLPLAGGWTRGRDLPAPEGRTFIAEYVRRKREAGR